MRDAANETDDGASRAGALLLVVAGAILLIVNVWHSLVGGNGLSGRALAELMVASAVWAPMHLLGSFGYGLLAAAAVTLLSSRGALRGTAARFGLGLLFAGSLAGTVGFVFDGQRAYLAPGVLRGEDLSLFVALTYLWDDRGIGVLTYVLIGVGLAVLAASQLGAAAVSPRWATAVGLLGAVVIAVVFFVTFGLRVFPGDPQGPLNHVVGVLGFATTFGWSILAGASLLRGQRTEGGRSP